MKGLDKGDEVRRRDNLIKKNSPVLVIELYDQHKYITMESQENPGLGVTIVIGDDDDDDDDDDDNDDDVS